MKSRLFGGKFQTEITALREHADSLEQRIRHLEDIEEIRTLHAKYHDYVDKGWDGKDVDPEGLRTVFTDDVFFRWSASDDAPGHEGLENVIAMLQESTEVWDMAMHSLLNEQIVVNGDTANGVRNDWVATRAADGRNLWFLKGTSTYVRTPEGWRIQKVDLRFAGKLLPKERAID